MHVYNIYGGSDDVSAVVSFLVEWRHYPSRKESSQCEVLQGDHAQFDWAPIFILTNAATNNLWRWCSVCVGGAWCGVLIEQKKNGTVV